MASIVKIEMFKFVIRSNFPIFQQLRVKTETNFDADLNVPMQEIAHLCSF